MTAALLEVLATYLLFESLFAARTRHRSIRVESVFATCII